MDDDFSDDCQSDAWHEDGWSDDDFGAEEYEEFVEREFGHSPVAVDSPVWVQATAVTVLLALVLILLAAAL